MDRYDDLMTHARMTNAASNTTQDPVRVTVQLRMAMDAIKTALNSRSWSCVAEAQALLEEVAAKL